jgi:C_GCAxxG_C_C family probable redox protein
MKTRQEQAISKFRSGLNCAQSVVSAYSTDFNFDGELALSISCAFGAGMGRLQETCGAVTGAFMVLGIDNCRKYSENKERKERTYAQVQEYSRQFSAIHGTLNCKTLINCDLRTPEGQKYFHDNNLHEAVCEQCIADSITVIDKLISK